MLECAPSGFDSICRCNLDASAWSAQCGLSGRSAIIDLWTIPGEEGHGPATMVSCHIPCVECLCAATGFFHHQLISRLVHVSCEVISRQHPDATHGRGQNDRMLTLTRNPAAFTAIWRCALLKAPNAPVRRHVDPQYAIMTSHK